MKKKEKNIGLNKTKDQKIKVQCIECNRETNHIVLQSVDIEGSEKIGSFQNIPLTVEWSGNYQIIQCRGCDSITFRKFTWCSEAEEWIEPDIAIDGTSTELYPKRSNKDRKFRTYYFAPASLRSIHQETVECFNNDSKILCAAGLRALVEGICAHQSIEDGPIEVEKNGSIETVRKRNLEGKISGLFERGALTQRDAEFLHQHRLLGNEALHELNRVKRSELSIALDIIEYILDSLYEIPDKAEELKTLRENRMNRRNDVT